MGQIIIAQYSSKKTGWLVGKCMVKAMVPDRDTVYEQFKHYCSWQIYHNNLLYIVFEHNRKQFEN